MSPRRAMCCRVPDLDVLRCVQRKDHADTLSAALLADRPLAVRTSIASVLHTMIAGDTVRDWPLAAVRPLAPILGLCHKRLH